MIKYLGILLLLVSIELNGQDHYNVAFDTTYISAIMQENIIVNGSLYGVGGAICSTGECGYFSKYTKKGEILWTIEYPQIDINSGQVMHYKNDRFYITGRAKDTVATKTLVLDTLGNVIDEWNYSIEGAVTNFSSEVYYDQYHYYFITEDEADGVNQGALYKCDYSGNLLERLMFPSLTLKTPLSVRPYKGNLIVSINHRYEENCPFGLGAFGPGATYLAEVDKETMTIIRDKKDVCYRSISNDIYVSPTSEIIRTVIIRDSMQSGNEGNFGIIYYDDNWDVNELIVFPHEFAKAITNIKYTKDGEFYYSLQGENVEQIDGSSWPFSDLLIQKWAANHVLLWEKRYYSHLEMKRLGGLNFSIDNIGDLHIVGFVWPDFPFTNTFDFWLFSVDAEGCHNGDCRDEVNLDDLVNTNTDIPVDNNNVIAYPNPVKSVLYIKHLENHIPITIIDAYGNIVLKEKYNVNSGIEVEDISNGIYFIQIPSKNDIRFIKI